MIICFNTDHQLVLILIFTTTLVHTQQRIKGGKIEKSVKHVGYYTEMLLVRILVDNVLNFCLHTHIFFILLFLPD